MKHNLKLVSSHELGGPSARFVRLSRNPDLPRPLRFEPTTKGEHDVII